MLMIVSFGWFMPSALSESDHLGMGRCLQSTHQEGKLCYPVSRAIPSRDGLPAVSSPTIRKKEEQKRRLECFSA